MTNLSTSAVPLQPMPREALKLNRLHSALRLGILSLGALIFLFVRAFSVDLKPGHLLGLQTVLTLLGIAAGIAWLVTWPPAAWKRRTWRLTPTKLEFHHGIIFQHEHQVPRSRVQHTEVTQGPLQRRYRLATLTIYTAGLRFADIQIAGLDVEVARSIRDELLNPSADHVV